MSVQVEEQFWKKVKCRTKRGLKNLKEGDIVENAKVKATTDWGIFQI